jgi:hypothetical protein
MESALQGYHTFVRRDHALCIFPPSNWLRQGAQTVRSSKWFDRIGLLLILANCVTLSLYDPLCGEDCKDKKQVVLDVAEYFFVAVFSAEILINILAKGFFFNKQGECQAYTQEPPSISHIIRAPCRLRLKTMVYL